MKINDASCYPPQASIDPETMKHIAPLQPQNQWQLDTNNKSQGYLGKDPCTPWETKMTL